MCPDSSEASEASPRANDDRLLWVGFGGRRRPALFLIDLKTQFDRFSGVAPRFLERFPVAHDLRKCGASYRISALRLRPQRADVLRGNGAYGFASLHVGHDTTSGQSMH